MHILLHHLYYPVDSNNTLMASIDLFYEFEGIQTSIQLLILFDKCRVRTLVSTCQENLETQLMWMADWNFCSLEACKKIVPMLTLLIFKDSDCDALARTRDWAGMYIARAYKAHESLRVDLVRLLGDNDRLRASVLEMLASLFLAWAVVNKQNRDIPACCRSAEAG